MRFKLLPVVTLLLIAGVANSADPQPYTVRIAPTANGAMDAALRASSQLESLRTRAPVGPFALVARAQDDVGRLQAALNSFGYYRGSVTVTINGRPLDDPDLPPLIAALPEKESAKVEVRVDPGVLFHIRKVTIDGGVDAAALKSMNLPSGTPAVASLVLAARGRLFAALGEEGHAYATVDQPVAYLDANEPVVDIRIKADPGPIYHLGEIHVEGLKKAKPAFVQRQLTLKPGALYRPSELDRVRSNLLGLGIFGSVSVQVPPRERAPSDRLPVTFVVVEQPLHAVSLNAAYSSDLGVSAGASWTDRDWLGHAEQLEFSASVIDLGCSGGCKGIGYDTSGLFTKPEFLQRGQSLQLGLTAIKQYLSAYNQIAATESTTLTRQLSSVWTVSAGATLEQEQVQQYQYQCTPTTDYPTVGLVADLPQDRTQWCHYTLLGFPVSGRYDSTNLANPLSEPTHGSRLSLSVTPTRSLFGSSHPTFVILQATVSTYYDLERLSWTEPGRSIIALRANVAQATGAGQFSLPPDQRLYAGGSTTVRGYAYQAIGPQFPSGSPIGGTALAAGTIELRQKLFGNFGLAAFIDAGGVSASATPFHLASSQAPTAYCTKRGTAVSYTVPPIRVGYGLGLRYFTPVGPIRFDIAVPRYQHACDAAFEVYIGLGEAF